MLFRERRGADAGGTFAAPPCLSAACRSLNSLASFRILAMIHSVLIVLLVGNLGQRGEPEIAQKEIRHTSHCRI